MKSCVEIEFETCKPPCHRRGYINKLRISFPLRDEGAALKVIKKLRFVELK